MSFAYNPSNMLTGLHSSYMATVIPSCLLGYLMTSAVCATVVATLILNDIDIPTVYLCLAGFGRFCSYLVQWNTMWDFLRVSNCNVEQGVVCDCWIPSKVTLDLFISRNTIKLRARVSDVQIPKVCDLFFCSSSMSTLVYKTTRTLSGFWWLGGVTE